MICLVHSVVAKLLRSLRRLAMSEDQWATKCCSMTVFNLFDITVSGQKGFVLCSESVKQIDKLCPVGLD